MSNNSNRYGLMVLLLTAAGVVGAATPAPDSSGNLEEVVITGVRASEQRSVELKYS